MLNKLIQYIYKNQHNSENYIMYQYLLLGFLCFAVKLEALAESFNSRQTDKRMYNS